MNASHQAIQNHQAAASKGKILGCITYWSLRGFRVPRETFKSELASMGLSAAYGRDMSPKAVLTRSVDVWMRGQREYSVKRLKAGVALLHSSISNGRVVTTHVWTATPDPTSGSLIWEHKDADGNVSGTKSDEMRKRLESCFQEVIDYASTSDLSSALTTAMQGTRKAPMLSACNLRGEAGGVYFVPAASLETFERLRDYITANSNSDVARFWISDIADNATEVQQNVRQTVEGELAELRASVLEFASECEQSGKDVGLKTINARAKRYDDLRVKVDLWADMLGDVAKEMRGKIAEASANLKRDLGISAPTGMPTPVPPKPEAEPEPEPEQPKFGIWFRVSPQKEAGAALEQAREMASKIKAAGFDACVHFAFLGESKLALVQMENHPVMGSGVMVIRDGASPEFTEGKLKADQVSDLAREKLSA